MYSFYCLAFIIIISIFIQRIICTYYPRASVWHIYTTFFLFIRKYISSFSQASAVVILIIDQKYSLSVKARRKMHIYLYTCMHTLWGSMQRRRLFSCKFISVFIRDLIQFMRSNAKSMV